MASANTYGTLVQNQVSNHNDADTARLTGTQTALFASDWHQQQKQVQESAIEGSVTTIGANKMTFQDVLTAVTNNIGAPLQINGPGTPKDGQNLIVGEFWKIDSVSSGSDGQISWYNNGSQTGIIFTVHPGDVIVWNGTSFVTFAARVADTFETSDSITATETSVAGGRRITLTANPKLDLVESKETALKNIGNLQTQSVKHLVKIGEYLSALESTIHVTQANANVTPNVAAQPFDPFVTGPTLADIRGVDTDFQNNFVKAP